jgi:hypothetical protein
MYTKNLSPNLSPTRREALKVDAKDDPKESGYPNLSPTF